MKKLAARDFEDILLCAIPCFEGLFPTSRVTNLVAMLLFDLTTWHGYAKLRLHTDLTILSLKMATEVLGKRLRSFETAAKKFNTRETPKESEARQRRKAAQNRHTRTDSTRQPPQAKGKSHQKVFNLATAKLHFLGDYPDAIKEYGSTDSYTTRNVSTLLLCQKTHAQVP